ncbi:MAG: DNA mismatch repair endonuclease MutL [Candidatus Rokubacteria bacterium]|nr:DNA mismatch repair endonuclease MutL [Candidatus Rokubacteria bacterium]
MSRIRRLPDHLVNKIAAGEVVERPAAVVKELVENALDAGARAVRVDLRDGGAALVRVVDDGIGMTADELILALERHATSKISADADLDSITTLGFRGEALPAICAVSRFTITSRPRGGPEGTRLSGAGGTIAQRLGIPADVGTAVEVNDLFFNTPARLKFLKSPATELAASLRVLSHLAVAHHDVQFRVTSNGRPVLTAPAGRDLRDRVGALWGYDTAARLLAMARREHGLAVEGLVSPPDLTRGGRDDMLVVVNGRPVRDPALIQAVLDAYRPLLPRDRFPLVVVTLALPPADVDANVHPTKAWVRFRHPRLAYSVIAEAVGAALRQQAVVPEVAAGRAAPGGASWPVAGVAGDQRALFAEAAAPYVAAELGRVLGQVQDTFIVAASDREVFFVDQHAAHERVLVERLEDELAAGRPVSQELLFPEALPLAPPARALLERWRETLEGLGFAFEGFGGDAIVLRAVPALLKGDEPKRLIEAAVDELGGGRAGEPVVERVLAFVACRAAIKAPTPLDREEMERLVAELGGTRVPYFCPHGRPTMSRISLGDIRREVRRLW